MLYNKNDETYLVNFIAAEIVYKSNFNDAADEAPRILSTHVVCHSSVNKISDVAILLIWPPVMSSAVKILAPLRYVPSPPSLCGQRYNCR